MTWFSSAFFLIGGGEAVVVAMIYTIVSDTTTDGKRFDGLPYFRHVYNLHLLACPQGHLFLSA